jgi:23S rRNA (guanosine2251-2'-O)-methyltransferase
MKEKGAGRSGQSRTIRMEEGLLWGTHPVFEALEQEPERISEVILHADRKGAKREEIIALAKGAGIKVSFVASIHLVGPDAAQARHQGVVARTSQAGLLPFETMLAGFAAGVLRGERPRLIILDSMQDPHNLGAIIRSAHASGMNGVVMTRERSAPLGGTAAKASAGAISHIDICQVVNLATALEKLKKAGAWIFGAVKEEAAQSIYQTDFNLPACVVVGSEGQGIRPLVRQHCDVLISIPMAGSLDSLNSSVAAGVIMFEMLRQRAA